MASLPDRLSLVRSRKAPGVRSVIDASVFGFRSYTTTSWPDRLYAGLDEAERPPSVLHGEAEIDVEYLPTPLDALLGGRSRGWPAETRASLERAEAAWLLTEDRFRLLDASAVEPLAHQASLVEHVLATPDLRRVLIADEVGLGKTVEAGLIIKRLVEQASGVIRVLYLTEARLVRNVVEEFERLGLRPREWSSQNETALIEPDNSDPLVVASMHRAAVNLERFAQSGPWNVIVIDEAHHLSDWSPDGSDPQRRMRLCRQLIADRLVPDGHVILLSGTPHQGSRERFKNLLRLLDEGGDHAGARGKVIYRIKDDITDWNGEPLFPKRRVNQPIEVDLGDSYAEWLTDVHELLTPEGGSRAMGWRRAQALQWCASSPQAGLAYLVRLALRARLTRRSLPVLERAMLCLRPYRGGSITDPVEVIETTLMRAQDMMDEDAEEIFQDSRRGLSGVLEMGADLVQSDAFGQKLAPVLDLLDENPTEKFVIFAQPVDTVYALKTCLEQELGRNAVSLVIGSQRPDERDREIREFRDGDRRVLVSSRAGGEGINLQVSRRLIHFDVPWNPMELEQRVGRVHRYGSTDTVVVDTLVLAGSREQRVLARSRARLGKIASDLDQDRIEVLFSRTMSHVPLEEIQALMAGENFGSLTPAEEERIDTLVTEGYREWKNKDAEFRRMSEHLSAVDRGAANESAFRRFLVTTVGAEPVSGWVARGFRVGDSGEPVLTSVPADVLKLPDGTLGTVGRSGGIGLFAEASRERPTSFGLNHEAVARAVRNSFGESGRDDTVSGAGTIRVDRACWESILGANAPAQLVRDGGIVLAYLRRFIDTGANLRELQSDLRAWVVSADASASMAIDGFQLGELFACVPQASSKLTVPAGFESEKLLAFEAERLRELGRDAPEKPFTGVFPLLAIWVEPGSRSGAKASE